MARAGEIKLVVDVEDHASRKLEEIGRYAREVEDAHRVRGYVLARTMVGETRRRALFIGPDDVAIRKAWIGWWVDGYWCPTRGIRDYWIECRLGRR